MPLSYLGYALVGGALFSNDHEVMHAKRSPGGQAHQVNGPSRFTLVGTKPFVERRAEDYPRFASTHKTREHLLVQQVLITTFKDHSVADSFTLELHTATKECKNS